MKETGNVRGNKKWIPINSCEVEHLEITITLLKAGFRYCEKDRSAGILAVGEYKEMPVTS